MAKSAGTLVAIVVVTGSVALGMTAAANTTVDHHRNSDLSQSASDWTYSSPSHKGFIRYPRWATGAGRIEAAHDKGLIIEMIVRCQNGAGIVVASKVDGLYCGPKHRCTSDLSLAISRVCQQP